MQGGVIPVASPLVLRPEIAENVKVPRGATVDMCESFVKFGKVQLLDVNIIAASDKNTAVFLYKALVTRFGEEPNTPPVLNIISETIHGDDVLIGALAAIEIAGDLIHIRLRGAHTEDTRWVIQVNFLRV